MMRSRTKTATLGLSKPPAFEPIKEIPDPAAVAKKFSSINLKGSPPVEVEEWEVRPGGMLVQKRDPDNDATARPPPPPIRVRVKYGPVYHEIYISPVASFAELKKLLSEKTGLHPQDQKLLFKDKERDNNAFLDSTGVKDRSKMVLLEDPTGQAKRLLEMRKNAKMEKAAKSIDQISQEVDKLARQVSALETLILKGKKVSESNVLSLIEQLMNQLLKLDGIIAEGDAKTQRRMQVRRVQKYVETLDVLKIKNSMPRENNAQATPPPSQQQQQKPSALPTQQQNNQYHQQQQQKQYQFHHTQQPMQQKPAPQPPVVVTTNWETFDLLSYTPSTSSASSTTTTASSQGMATPAAVAPPPRFNWELF